MGLTHGVRVGACYVPQSDPEGPIRVNTVILLGRIAPLLRADTRDAVRAGDGCQHTTHAHNVSVACVHLRVCGCGCVTACRRSWARLRKPCATRLVMYDSLQCGVFRQRTRASTVPYVSRSTTPVLLDCGRGAGEPVLTLAWHRLWVGCADALQAVAAPCVPHDGGSVGGCSQRGVPTHGCDDGALLGGCHAAYHAA